MLLLLPAASLFALFAIGLALFTGLWFSGRIPAARGVKHNELFGPFFGQFLVWMCTPLERLFLGRVSANKLTAASLGLCVASGVAAGTGHFTAAAWMFALGGILDAVDGRIARLNDEQSQAGALHDSVSDRWGELAVGTGFTWFLRDTPWMLAAVAATGGSMMVSYTRARAEGLGVELRGGMMQRAERVVLISLGTFVAAGFSVYVPNLVTLALGCTMMLAAVTSIATALSRWVQAYRELARRESVKQTQAATATATEGADDSSATLPMPATLRESDEMEFSQARSL